MASERIEYRRELAELGFKPFRAGSKHEIWSNGYHRVLVGRTDKAGHSAMNSIVRARKMAGELPLLQDVQAMAKCVNGTPCERCRAAS